MKRITYISGSVFPSRAANTVNTIRLCSELAKAGWEVTLLIPQLPATGTPAEVRKFFGVDNTFHIQSIGSRYQGRGSVYLRAWAIARWLRRQPDTLIYGRDALILSFCALLGLQVNYDAHRPPRYKSGIAGWLKKRLWRSRQLLAVSVISQALVPKFRAAGLSAERIHLIRNASSDISSIPPKVQTRGPLIGYTGHLFPGRGVDLILEAAKALPQYRFLLVGGTEADLQYWRAAGLTKNVDLIGFVRADEVAGYIRSCDLLLAPYQEQVSVWGGQENSVDYMSPIKLFEYLSSGIPMVVSDLPAIREFLDESMVTFCPPADRASWIAAIANNLENDTAAQQRASKALMTFREHYSWDRKIEKIKALLHHSTASNE